MMKVARRALMAGLLLVSAPASAACLPTEEIDAKLGEQIRSGAPNLDVGEFVGKPLCSGLTLAQQIQQIRANALAAASAAAKAKSGKPRRP